MNQLQHSTSLTLTDTAAARIREFLAKNPEAKGFKIDLKKYGCSGWGYEVSLPTDIAADELVLEDKGISLIVPAEVIDKIDGTVIDFEKQGINQIFTYKNPQATGECGCGESFTTTETVN